jgi:hypothetical protein
VSLEIQVVDKVGGAARQAAEQDATGMREDEV